MKTKRETLASLERKLKTKNLEKMRQNTGKKFYLQKETDKNTHKHTRDNLWIICFKQKDAKSKDAANNTKYTHSPTQTHKPVVGLRPEVFSEKHNNKIWSKMIFLKNA